MLGPRIGEDMRIIIIIIIIESAIYETVQHVPDALEIVDQYIMEKEILPVGDPNKDVLVSKL